MNAPISIQGVELVACGEPDQRPVVTWTGGELWHGTWQDGDSDVRRIDPETGEVLELLEMPTGTGVSGLESDGRDRFFCGTGGTGRVRAIRRPRKDAAVS